jgi:hypothetical protein
MEAFNQNDSHSKLQTSSAKAIPFLWLKLPDINPTEVILVKDKTS